MKIILISGKSGSGKDTLANFMRKEYEAQGKKVLTIHFADCVKFYAQQYYGWDGVTKDAAARTLFQTLGTDKVRKKFPNYWANLVGQFLSAIDGDFDYVLIPDTRFLNEISHVKRYNKDCVTLRINKLNGDGTFIFNPALTPEQNAHPSECELDDYCCDIMINNCDTLVELEKDSKEIVKMIEKGE